MDICRVVHKADGSVSVIYPVAKVRRITVKSPNGYTRVYTDHPVVRDGIPNLEKLGAIVTIEPQQDFLDRVFAKCTKEAGLEGLPFEDIDPATLPDRKDREKWRKKAGGGVEVDLSVVTASDRREIDNAALQVERRKPAPNMKNALDLMLKLQENNY